MELLMKNILRYLNVNKLHQAPGNSLCVALPRFHAFTGIDYKSNEGKIWPHEIIWEKWRHKKLLSEGEVQTTFKAIEQFTWAMYGRK